MIKAMERRREPELMDDPALDEQEHLRALRGLERVNAVSGSALFMWRAMRPVLEASPSLTLLDIASGSGDIPITVGKMAALKNFDLHITGTDISERAVNTCRQRATDAGISADFFTLNILEETITGRYDVVTTSLFTHHLDPPDVVRLLRKMAGAARKLVIVNDLERSRMNWVQVAIASRLFSSSPVVHFDGPTSVRAAYTVDEFRDMAAEAGLSGCIVERRYPCRLLLRWVPNE